jgi:membrane protein
VVFATTALAGRAVHAVGNGRRPDPVAAGHARVRVGIGVNVLLSIGVLTGLPRLRIPQRRVLGPALLVAAGLGLLKTLG